MSEVGIPLRATEDIIEIAAPIIDYAKITDHAGLVDRLSAAWIKKKVALYNKAGIDVVPGGIPFQLAVIQTQGGRLSEGGARPRVCRRRNERRHDGADGNRLPRRADRARTRDGAQGDDGNGPQERRHAVRRGRGMQADTARHRAGRVQNLPRKQRNPGDDADRPEARSTASRRSAKTSTCCSSSA